MNIDQASMKVLAMNEQTTGTIFEIRKFAIHDGPGIRTTVFLKGCPLNCAWCHNPEGVSPEVVDYDLRPRDDGRTPAKTQGQARIGRVVTVDTIMREVVKDEVFYNQSGGGVTFSGGEPMMQPAFLEALLISCKGKKYHTAVDTCGQAPAEDFEHIYDLVDLFLFDLKLIDTSQHRTYTGMSNDLILSNLALLAGKGEKVIVRIPMIPDITDTEGNLDAIAAYLEPLKSIRRISLLPYNKYGEDKIDRYQMSRRRLQLERQSPPAMDEKASRLRSRGFEVRIGG